MLQLHNSLTGRKEEFQPLHPGKVGLYVCGVTVYDYCHLGHARFLLVFDSVVRHLKALGYDVHYVRNITDVDDKIIRRAEEGGEDTNSLTERYIGYFHEDCDWLGLLPADAEPRATVHMPQIIAMIERLVEREHAYAADNGDVYFSVASFPDYGRLSGKRLDELRIGARIQPGEAKRDALDFVLWKAAKPDEPAWESPWGWGRPGWHIECSAMSTHCLGEEFDIHGGGMDLKFPHHENEIAQSVCATGKGFVHTWLHNGFVQVEGEKMSKSLGNFRTIRDLAGEYSGEEVRYFVLGSHYRSPLTYTREAMDASRSGLNRLYSALDGVTPAGEPVAGEATETFTAAMNDDLNTPQAYSVLHDLARQLNAAKAAGKADRAAAVAAELIALGGRLGLLQQNPRAVLQGDVELAEGEIQAAIDERREAKVRRDFARADGIRDRLAAAGVQLEDGPQGTTWRRAN